MLRSRFESLPEAFNEHLIPSDSHKSKGLRAAFTGKPSKTSGDEQEKEKIAARFAQMWNLIITSFREEDLIDNREMDLLLVPYCKDRELNIFQWPPFLLASKVFSLPFSKVCLFYWCIQAFTVYIYWILDSNSIGYGGRQWRKRS
jgi:callose synthase